MFRFKTNPTSKTTDTKLTPDLLPVTSQPILNAPDHHQPVPAVTLTESQQQKLDRLHEHMATILLPSTHEYFDNEKRFLTTSTLKRYMRARKWDYEAETGKMYFNGFDRCGRPIWIMRPRLENSKDGERQVKHIIFSLERGIRLMPNKVENIAIIVDFKDSSAAHNPSLNTCKKFLDILGNHYPERLGIAFVVKSPWFFFATFKIISPFMDIVTKSKIKFVYDHADDEKKENKKATTNEWVYLHDFIDSDQLETDFGGDYPFKYDFGYYWKDLMDSTGNPYKIIDY